MTSGTGCDRGTELTSDDVRLTAALQDVEDLRQELEGETNRANVAESRLSAFTVKYGTSI